jgi:RNA polymerase sigma-70 factor, ECF subfamily
MKMTLSPGSAGQADALLVEQALRGQTRAFDLLVIKYQARVQRLIGRWVRDPAAVEDLTQDTFIKAYQALPQFRGDAQFYTWLYRIAVNAAKKYLLAQRTHIHTVSLDEDGRDGETFSGAMYSTQELADHNTPEALLASEQIAQAVQQALDALPEDLRQAVTLREVDGMTYEDIAQLMACPIGTVRSRIFRAREAISKVIKEMLSQQTGKRW